MNSKLQKLLLIIVWTSLLLSSGFLVIKHVRAMDAPEWAGKEEVSKPERLSGKLALFSRIFNLVLDNYYRDIDSDTLLIAAINGMIEKLDPNTQYMQKSEVSRLTEDTKGKYGGLGIMISGRSNRIVVITPFDGSPAAEKGIRSGDLILAIDGTSTYKLPMDKAVDMMRGEVGEDVTLTIKRANVPEPLDITITRDIIDAPNIQNTFIIKDDIGYIKLTRFSKDVHAELKQALEQLQKQDMKKVILDLRNNPGGLLEAAYQVSEVFLQKGQKIVYTKGRMPEQNRTFISREEPFVKNMPLVVMVNEGSASASEIVAGAIQDWDLGLVVGDTSFGKGSVQTMVDLSDDDAFKYTAARYFTPSGRCIHKEENWTRSRKDGWEYYLESEMEVEPIDEFGETEEADSVKFNWDKFLDSLKLKKPSYWDKDTAATAFWKDSIAFENKLIEERHVFKTDAGRIVFGGGGITPDIVIKAEPYSDIMSFLIRSNTFLEYTADYISKNKDMNPEAITITPAIMNEFYEYSKKYYDYSVDEWKKARKKAKDEFEEEEVRSKVKALISELIPPEMPMDSAKYEVLLRDLKELVTNGYYFYFTKEDFYADEEQIREYLKAEFIRNIYEIRGKADQGGQIKYQLLTKFDNQLQKAIEVLEQAKTDKQLLQIASSK